MSDDLPGLDPETHTSCFEKKTCVSSRSIRG